MVSIDFFGEHLKGLYLQNNTIFEALDYIMNNYAKVNEKLADLKYITEKRMVEAVKLLSDNNLKIYEISEKLGYDDCKYFFKLFKKRYGISPTTLRMQNDKRKNFQIGSDFIEEDK